MIDHDMTDDPRHDYSQRSTVTIAALTVAFAAGFLLSTLVNSDVSPNSTTEARATGDEPTTYSPRADPITAAQEGMVIPAPEGSTDQGPRHLVRDPMIDPAGDGATFAEDELRAPIDHVLTPQEEEMISAHSPPVQSGCRPLSGGLIDPTPCISAEIARTIHDGSAPNHQAVERG